MAALSALRTDLQRRFQDKSAGYLSATPANLYINIACEDFQNDVQPIWREYGWYPTAYQFRYDLPADYVHTRSMMWYQTGQGEPVRYISPTEWKEQGFFQKKSPSSIPEAYTIIDNDVYLWPAPSASSNTSTLNGTHSSSVTTIAVGDGTKFYSDGGIILVESEQIAYQRVSSNNLTLALRGQGGTTAASHTPGSGTITVYRQDLVMVYESTHVYMSADADTPSFSARYHRLPLHYAMHLALKTDGRDQQAQEELQLYMLEKQKAKAEIRKQTRDVNNRKIMTPYA